MQEGDKDAMVNTGLYFTTRIRMVDSMDADDLAVFVCWKGASEPLGQKQMKNLLIKYGIYVFFNGLNNQEEGPYVTGPRTTAQILESFEQQKKEWPFRGSPEVYVDDFYSYLDVVIWGYNMGSNPDTPSDHWSSALFNEELKNELTILSELNEKKKAKLAKVKMLENEVREEREFSKNEQDEDVLRSAIEQSELIEDLGGEQNYSQLTANVADYAEVENQSAKEPLHDEDNLDSIMKDLQDMEVESNGVAPSNVIQGRLINLVNKLQNENTKLKRKGVDTALAEGKEFAKAIVGSISKVVINSASRTSDALNDHTKVIANLNVNMENLAHAIRAQAEDNRSLTSANGAFENVEEKLEEKFEEFKKMASKIKQSVKDNHDKTENTQENLYRKTKVLVQNAEENIVGKVKESKNEVMIKLLNLKDEMSPNPETVLKTPDNNRGGRGVLSGRGAYGSRGRAGGRGGYGDGGDFGGGRGGLGVGVRVDTSRPPPDFTIKPGMKLAGTGILVRSRAVQETSKERSRDWARRTNIRSGERRRSRSGERRRSRSRSGDRTRGQGMVREDRGRSRERITNRNGGRSRSLGPNEPIRGNEDKKVKKRIQFQE